MKILALNASPRKDKGTTDILLNHFLKAANAETTKHYITDLDIKGCMGCFNCWTKTPGICVRKDDMPQVLPKVAQAEMLVPADALLLARVFPVLGRVPAIARAQAPQTEVRDPRDLRTRAFNSLRELLRRIAECAPVVMFVDDLQWADADGLALIAEVLHGPEAPTLLFIATVRGDGREPMPATEPTPAMSPTPRVPRLRPPPPVPWTSGMKRMSTAPPTSTKARTEQ